MANVADTPIEPAAEVIEPVEQVAEPEVAPEKQKDEPIPRGVQKRIDRAVRQKYEAEARANESGETPFKNKGEWWSAFAPGSRPTQLPFKEG